MFYKHAVCCVTGMVLLAGMLSSCFRPPYNNFKPDYFDVEQNAFNNRIGNTTVAGYSLFQTIRPQLIKRLKARHIQFEQYGDTMTLIIPTDRYYRFNSPHFNDACYPGLLLILKFLSFYPTSTIYIAGFTDSIGSASHKDKLSQAQAETMLSFLWANNIDAKRLHAQGYGEKYDIADNDGVHGSAQNRRIEIQWFAGPLVKNDVMPYLGPTK